MNRRGYDPMAGMLSLREAMNRLLEESFVAGGMTGSPATQIPLDMYETGDNLVVRASMPGVPPDNIDITVNGDSLALRAELPDTAPTGDDVRHHQREHRYGTMTRSLTLPVEVQPDKAEASFEHGVLTLTMPKAARLQPRTIKINMRGSEPATANE